MCEALKAETPFNNSTRRLNLTMLYSSDQREDLIFSATMPKAKNQSRRVYSLVLGGFRRRFLLLLLKKEEWGISVVFGSFLKKNISG